MKSSLNARSMWLALLIIVWWCLPTPGRRCGLVVQRANSFTGGRAFDPEPRHPLFHSRDRVLRPSSGIWLADSVRFSTWLHWFRKIGHLVKNGCGTARTRSTKKKSTYTIARIRCPTVLKQKQGNYKKKSRRTELQSDQLSAWIRKVPFLYIHFYWGSVVLLTEYVIGKMHWVYMGIRIHMIETLHELPACCRIAADDLRCPRTRSGIPARYLVHTRWRCIEGSNTLQMWCWRRPL